MARVASGCWTVAGYVAGRLGRWTPARWRSPGGLRVLVVATHPDDEIGCGGAMLLHSRAGDEVYVVYVTDGRGSRAGGIGADEMADLRRREAAVVAPALGVRGTHWLGLREWQWEEPALVAALAQALREIAPQVLYAPSRIDFHPEHVRVASCVDRALAAHSSGTMTVRMYQMQVPLTPLLVNLVASIAPVSGELRAALRGYRTQLGSIERCWRMKRYAAACYGLPGHVEEFWEVDADAFHRVHASASAVVEVAEERRAGGAEPAFRGLRSRPFTDPLSYFVGVGARRRLRRLARDGGRGGRTGVGP